MRKSLCLILVDSQGIFEWEMRHLWRFRDAELRSGKIVLTRNSYLDTINNDISNDINEGSNFSVEVIYSECSILKTLQGESTAHVAVLCSKDELKIARIKRDLEGQKIKTFSAPTNEDPEPHLAREVLAYLGNLIQRRKNEKKEGATRLR